MKKLTVTLEFELKSSCDHGGVFMCVIRSDNLSLKKVLYFLDDPELVEICRLTSHDILLGALFTDFLIDGRRSTIGGLRLGG